MKQEIRFLFWVFKKGGKKTVIAGVFSLFFNFLGALLEGVAYLFMIVALSVLLNDKSHGSSWLWTLGVNLGLSLKALFFVSISLGILSQMLKGMFCYVAASLAGEVLKQTQGTLQAMVLKHVFKLPYAKVQRYKMGELTEVMRSPANFLRPLLESCNLFCVGVCITLVSLGLLVFISPSLSALTLTLFASAFFVHKIFSKKAKKRSYAFAKHLAKMSAFVTQSLNGLKTVHVYNQQRSVLQQTDFLIAEVGKNSKKLIQANAAVIAFTEMAGILTVGLILGAGTFLLSSGNTSLLPSLLGFVTVAYRLSGKVQGAMSSAMIVGSYMGDVRQVRELLENNNQDILPKQTLKGLNFKKEILLKNLSFSYPEASSCSLQNITLSIRKGEVTALCGRSGAGKSTLVDLLLGLYAPCKGEILIDDLSLCQIDIEQFRAKVGVVLQESIIFSGTVEENIRFGQETISFEEIKEAARKAHADVFIEGLNEGYQTQLGEKGYRLSGGEKQRLALARALLKKPAILLLDEATSNLDSRSESYIQEALEELRGEITIIVVAHRLSTVVNADKIYVLEEGHLIEEGQHHQLVELKGLYASFWEKQSGAVAPRAF